MANWNWNDCSHVPLKFDKSDEEAPHWRNYGFIRILQNQSNIKREWDYLLFLINNSMVIEPPDKPIFKGIDESILPIGDNWMDANYRNSRLMERSIVQKGLNQLREMQEAKHNIRRQRTNIQSVMVFIRKLLGTND